MAVRHRKKILAFAAGLIVVATILFSLSRPDRGPSYGGRSLNEWLQLYEKCGTDEVPWARRDEIAAAVRHIGPDAIPVLLKWIQYEPRPWQKKIAKELDKLPNDTAWNSLPQSLTYSSSRFHQIFTARRGFEILGPQAASAIPELTKLLHDTNRWPENRSAAAHALAALGVEAIPALVQCLTNDSARQRSLAASAIFNMSYLGSNASPLIPPLIRASQDKDGSTAAMAVQALANLQIEPEIVVPALTNAFRATNGEVRFWAVRSFVLTLREEAYRAAPALQGMLNDSDYRIGMDASFILTKLGSNSPSQTPAP